AVRKGIDPMTVLEATCLIPVKHYRLAVGLLQPDDPADFIRVKDLRDFEVLETYVDGKKVAEYGSTSLPYRQPDCPNQFNSTPKTPSQFSIKSRGSKLLAIEVLDGELITRKKEFPVKAIGGMLQSDLQQDVLKIAVINRYKDEEPALACIHNFGLQEGAIASCVAHDSHNIIAVGVDDESICRAVNLIIQHKGGISAVSGTKEKVLPLPVAGIMSDQAGDRVGKAYAELDQMAREMGSQLRAPFMSLSFMGLLVIPSLKLSDQGLFDGDSFSFTPLFPTS
ncbi:MAG: adenine deaminase C-terminal domain-containing protein, partial [Bacteroidota bacterium]